MYLEIKPLKKDKDFSYIIYKNPDNVYTKNLSSSRSVTGYFKKDKSTYQVIVKNDPINFLKIARELNLPNYVHTQLSAICPYNLVGITNVFNSVIKGKYENSGLSPEVFFKKIMLEAIIGPYPIFDKKIKEIFESLNISVETIYFKEITVKNYNNACMLKLTTTKPISITEFLQKIYIILYYGTMKYNLSKIEEQNIKKFISLSKNWLDDCCYRKGIINSLCRRNKEFIKEFESSIIEDKDSDNDRDLSFLEKKSLHSKRHDIIHGKISEIPELKNSLKISLIDLGCGRGQLIKKLLKIKSLNILGIEADNYKLKYLFKTSRVRLLNSNIVYPNMSENDLYPDILVCSEVIEHLTEYNRKLVLENIKNMIKPKYIILTTPNITYNEKYGLIDEYRHKDHKIEYNEKEFKTEVVDYLAENYDIEYIPLLPEEEIQPSFIIFCVIKKNDVNKKINKIFNRIKGLYNNIYLDTANYTINSKEISNGYASKQMMNNNIFYYAPTIAPVEYSNAEPDYLEHPVSAFNYFQERGINKIAVEHKYMGSRAYVLAFRNEEIADYMGYKPITINSRQGYPFFDDKEFLQEIWKSVKDKMITDFVMLDCEILPWSLKAKGLIEKSFLIPGQCSYLSRVYEDFNESGEIDNASKFLESLNNFIKDDKFSIKMFQLLAMGDVKCSKKKYFINYINGLLLDRISQYKILKELEGDIFNCTKYDIIDLSSSEDKERLIKNWIKYCNTDGEGFVFKPLTLSYLPNGYFVQPALKVRGKDYLRLIYGIDYLEKEIFNKLSNRIIRNKRALAVKQFEMSIKIIRCFLNCNEKELKRHIAGFIGMENRITPNIDATL